MNQQVRDLNVCALVPATVFTPLGATKAVAITGPILDQCSYEVTGLGAKEGLTDVEVTFNGPRDALKDQLAKIEGLQDVPGGQATVGGASSAEGCAAVTVGGSGLVFSTIAKPRNKATMVTNYCAPAELVAAALATASAGTTPQLTQPARSIGRLNACDVLRASGIEAATGWTGIEYTASPTGHSCRAARPNQTDETDQSVNLDLRISYHAAPAPDLEQVVSYGSRKGTLSSTSQLACFASVLLDAPAPEVVGRATDRPTEELHVFLFDKTKGDVPTSDPLHQCARAITIANSVLVKVGG